VCSTGTRVSTTSSAARTGVTSIAARVSNSSPAYLTFTVGELELEKCRRELQRGDVMGPTFTVQGTVTHRETGTFVCGAVTTTADLIGFIDEHPDLVQTRTNTMTGRPFHVVVGRGPHEVGPCRRCLHRARRGPDQVGAGSTPDCLTAPAAPRHPGGDDRFARVGAGPRRIGSMSADVTRAVS
jgi:hypothetical protein